MARIGGTMNSIITGSYTTTVSLSATDSPQGLPTVCKQNAQAELYAAVLITVENNGIRISYNSGTPTQGASGVGHYITSGSTMRIIGTDNIAGFRFINYTNGQNALLQVTSEA